MENKIVLNKKARGKIQLQNITIYFEYAKNNKKFEECIENILKLKLANWSIKMQKNRTSLKIF